MKVALVTWFFPKISETFILNQIIELKSKGHDVDIIAVKNPSIHLVSEDLEVETQIHKVVVTNKLLSQTMYFTIEDLYKYINSSHSSYNVLYLQFGNIASEIFKCGHVNLPAVVLFHNIDNITNKKYFSKQQILYNGVFKNATVILAISEFCKTQLIKLGCNPNKIFIHHMAIDTKIFTFNQDVSIANNEFRFLMIGRFVEKKGFEYGIRSFDRLTQLYPKNRGLRLTIIGDGILRPKLLSLIKKLPSSHYIEITGKLKWKDEDFLKDPLL